MTTGIALLKRLFGTPAITPTERDLLTTIRDTAIPDPTALRLRLAGLTQQIDEAEREWERLDRRGDAAGFLALTPIAERLQKLRAAAGPLPDAIAEAEQRRAAFLSLAHLFQNVAATVVAQTDALLARPPLDPAERLRQLRALDHSTRLHVRLAHRLAAISSSPTFREPEDALALLRDTYTEHIRQCDLLRTPGHKPRFEWPRTITELLAVIELRERTLA